MAWMPRLELLRSDEIEQRPLVELLEQIRPDLPFPGDVDDEGDGLSAGIWRSVGEARELRPPVRRPPCRHPVSPKFLRQLALRRYRRHLDSAVRDGGKTRPRQNRREKQRHCKHRHFHFNWIRDNPLTFFASSRTTSSAPSGKLPPVTQDRLEVDTGQVGRSQAQASKNP